VIGSVLLVTSSYSLVELGLLCLQQNQVTVSLRKSLIDPVSNQSSTEVYPGLHKQGRFRGYPLLCCFDSS